MFVDAFKGKDFKVVSGLNPCIIEYAGVRINVYIKNLTPAQLSNNNPDVWRCQLPSRPIFDDFKKSENLFLLLGYDAANDVYTTWNPYWTKQRLNIGLNISMYSRYSVQKEAAKKFNILQYDLNHNGIVVAMPRMLLTDYIDKYSDFFGQETKYVAIGSSLKNKKMISSTDKTNIKLINVCSPETLKNIAELMLKDEPDEMEAMQLLYNSVGDQYNNTMCLAEWIKLLRGTDWTKF